MDILEYLLNMVPMIGLFSAGGIAMHFAVKAYAHRHQAELARMEEDIRAGRVEVSGDAPKEWPLDLEVDDPWNLATDD
jgi:hypothetical protein